MGRKEKAPDNAGATETDRTSKNDLSEIILPFPMQKSRCAVCGVTFYRKRADTWRRLCLQCWRWHRLGVMLSGAARLARVVGP